MIAWAAATSASTDMVFRAIDRAGCPVSGIWDSGFVSAATITVLNPTTQTRICAICAPSGAADRVASPGHKPDWDHDERRQIAPGDITEVAYHVRTDGSPWSAANPTDSTPSEGASGEPGPTWDAPAG